MDIPPLAVSTTVAFKAIGVGRSLGYDFIKSGQLLTIKLGRRTLIPTDALKAFIDSKKQEAA
jgi:hypothetical protein